VDTRADGVAVLHRDCVVRAVRDIDGESVGDIDGVAVAVADTEPVADDDDEALGEDEADRDILPVAVTFCGVAVVVIDGTAEKDCVTVCVLVPRSDGDSDALPVALDEPELVGERDCVSVTVALTVRLAVDDGESVGVDVTVPDAETVPHGDGTADPDAFQRDGDALPLTDGATEKEPDTDGDRLSATVADDANDAERGAVADDVAARVAPCERETETEGVTVCDAKPDGETETEGEIVAPPLADGDCEGDRDTELQAELVREPPGE